MSAKLQLVLISIALCAAWVLSMVPFLHTYALQFFAGIVLVFFMLKRMQRSAWLHLAPSSNSYEMALLSFGFFFLIAATGNVSSPFFMLSFIHLFFLSLSTPLVVALIVVVETVILHILLTPAMTTGEFFSLLPLPLTLIIFVVAHEQYKTLQKTAQLLEKETDALVETKKTELSIYEYLVHTVLPQLQSLRETARQSAMAEQIETLYQQTYQFVERIRQK